MANDEFTVSVNYMGKSREIMLLKQALIYVKKYHLSALPVIVHKFLTVAGFPDYI